MKPRKMGGLGPQGAVEPIKKRKWHWVRFFPEYCGFHLVLHYKEKLKY
jgi:hypothetical protein